MALAAETLPTACAAVDVAADAADVAMEPGAALADGLADRLGVRKTFSAVKGTRHVRKADMKVNDWLPRIEVDAQTYEVRADGQLLRCEHAVDLPLAQRYFLF